MDITVGTGIGVGSIVIGLLLQADVPVVKEIGNYLIPFNTAVVTLLWWRITQLEKQVTKMDGRIYRMRLRMGQQSEHEEDED